jgi:hypothetical protein
MASFWAHCDREAGDKSEGNGVDPEKRISIELLIQVA